MNPKDYTLEEWIKLWQEAHVMDAAPTPQPPFTMPYMPELPFQIPDPAPFPFNPTNPYREWWRKTYAEPSITTDHT